MAIIAATAACLASFVCAAAASGPAEDRCDVDVTPTATAPMALDVAIRCNTAGRLVLHADTTRMAGFVAEVLDGNGRPVATSGRDWRLDRGSGPFQEARYRYELDAYLDEVDNVMAGIRRGNTRLSLVDGWLLQPMAAARSLPVAIRVHTGEGSKFSAGLAQREGRYLVEDLPARFAGYTAFGAFEPIQVSVPAPPFGAGAGQGATGSGDPHVELVVMDGKLSASREQLSDWVRLSARAVARYFGGYSAVRSMIAVVPTAGDGVPYGRVVPGDGISMMIRVGERESARRLYDEWVLVHEMIHTATPFVYGHGSWLMEGLATFLEPVIRARAGWKTEQDVWREWIRNMDRGVQALAETGLDANASSAGYYWGGGLFMLLADIQIRRNSGGRLGLEDCLRSILRDGGNATQRVSVSEMLIACDKAVGGTAMVDLARRYVYSAAPVDLPGLWRSLGVSLAADGAIMFDDSAPLAGIRRLVVLGRPDQRLPPLPMGGS